MKDDISGNVETSSGHMETFITFMTKTIPKKDTRESEVGVCWYYMDEDWANTHYQKFLKESNQVVLEIIFQMEIDDGE